MRALVKETREVAQGTLLVIFDLQGEQVDAREWWDGHWIEDRILAKLREFGAEPAAGGAAAASSASPSP